MATLPTAKWTIKMRIKMCNERANCWKFVTHSFVFIVGETCCNVVCVCLRMSTNVFIWIKHGTHRWFEQIRFPNFHNYLPILRPRVSDEPWYRSTIAPIRDRCADILRSMCISGNKYCTPQTAKQRIPSMQYGTLNK